MKSFEGKCRYCGEIIDMTTGRPCTITRTCKNVINGELEE